MFKLNNKGLTVVEIIICFALASIIIISMFNVVNSYKDKESQEGYKNDIYTYKNTISKTIQDDIINNEGITVASEETTEGTYEYGGYVDSSNKNYYFVKRITLTYKSGKDAIITISNKTRCFSKDSIGNKNNDQNCVEGTNEENIDYQNSTYWIEYRDSNGITERFVLPKIFYLRFNDVEVVDGTQGDNPTGIIKIHVGFIHPDLGNQYDALNIITPNVNSNPGMLG